MLLRIVLSLSAYKSSLVLDSSNSLRSTSNAARLELNLDLRSEILNDELVYLDNSVLYFSRASLEDSVRGSSSAVILDTSEFICFSDSSLLSKSLPQEEHDKLPKVLCILVNSDCFKITFVFFSVKDSLRESTISFKDLEDSSKLNIDFLDSANSATPEEYLSNLFAEPLFSWAIRISSCISATVVSNLKTSWVLEFITAVFWSRILTTVCNSVAKALTLAPAEKYP